MKFEIFFAFLLCNALGQKFDPMDMIISCGYKGEILQAQSEDGYLLSIYRIVPKNLQNVKKPPVLLIHGFASTCLDYVLMQNDSLSSILVDNGYDVYMGNTRGTKFSTHTTFSNKSSEFWNFTLHEIAFYDIAALIDHVLLVTNSQKLFIVGISQGGGVPLALTSSRPEYNEKIIQAHLMAPAAILKNSLNSLITDIGPLLIDILAQNNMLEYWMLLDILKPIIRASCNGNNQIGQTLCNAIATMIIGVNIKNVELELISSVPDRNTEFISVKHAKHFLQLAKSGKYQQYDYGTENIKYYGSNAVPEYDLTKVTMPVYIYGGGQDSIVAKKDIELLRDRLPNVVKFKIIDDFNHYEFAASRRCVNEVYMEIMLSFESYNSY